MKRVIAADIGGTNCRLGLFRLEAGELMPERSVWVETCDVEHPDSFVHAIEHELNTHLDDAEALVVAVAGPVEDNICGHLTNGKLTLDMRGHAKKFPHVHITVINDFMAQAYAVIDPLASSAPRIAGPAISPEHATRAVIGAGTGLGYASIHWVDAKAGKQGYWMPFPSENGHAAFPFVNKRENEFHSFLKKNLEIPCACGDDVLAGRGLSLLHEFLTGEKLAPSGVGKNALSSDTETLEWYSRFYGRACRCWIMATLCSGGLWIAGGIAAQNPRCVQSEHFEKELYGNPRWEDYLRQIPVYLQDDKNSGLQGAANLARQIVLE